MPLQLDVVALEPIVAETTKGEERARESHTKDLEQDLLLRAIVVFLSAIESAKRNRRKRLMLKKDLFSS